MLDFMILQISHPLLSLFTLLPLWLMKLWNVSRLGIYLLYHVLHIANKPLNKNRYFVFNLRSEELWTWWFTHFHVSPQTSVAIYQLSNLNILIRIIPSNCTKTKTLTPNIYDFMTCNYAVLLSWGCLCVSCAPHFINRNYLFWRKTNRVSNISP